ncbi:MAG: ion transporter [bacterium]
MASKLRNKLYLVLEKQHGDWEEKLLNVFLMTLILLNVVAIVLESETGIYESYRAWFRTFETFSVFVFLVEYLVRVWVSVENPAYKRYSARQARFRYMLTPMAIIDLLSIAPFFLGFMGIENLLFLRSLRLVRVFKLTRYSHSMNLLLTVLKNESEVLISALFIVFILIVLASTGIHIVEGDQQPDAFGSIPRAIWWATVTLTTVGYGDVVPITDAGKVFSGIITITGVAVAALPAGILASGLTKELDRRRDSFKTAILMAMEDGELSFNELRHLEEMRREIAISRADARLIFEEVKHESRITSTISCPHCQGSIDINHPPGHIQTKDNSG